MPRISVLMPVFNGELYLAAAVESVLAQSFEDFELIVVDDGSTDRSIEIAATFAEYDPRVRLLRKRNSGISETLNLGLGAAQGDWIARIDADDLMLPQRLARQIAFVGENRDLVAAGSYYDIIDATGRRRVTRYPLPRTRLELARYLEDRELLTFTHPTMIFRRDVAARLGGYRRALEPCEDADLFSRMLARGCVILIQPEVLTLYRVHPGSVSSARTAEMFTKLRFIYHNFYAARDGIAQLSFAEYLAFRRQLSVLARLRTARDYAAEALYRSHTSALVQGRPLRATLALVGAAALRPRKALRRGVRNLPGRLARVAG